jgi:hypothetical protein
MQTYGLQHYKTALVQHDLGEVARRKGDLDTALVLYAKALSTLSLYLSLSSCHWSMHLTLVF